METNPMVNIFIIVLIMNELFNHIFHYGKIIHQFTVSDDSI